MGRVHTFANGEDVFPSQLNAIQDDYEGAFATWRTVSERNAALGGQPAGDYIIAPGYVGLLGNTTNVINAGAFRLDPADFTVGGRAVRVRVVTTLLTIGTAPGASFRGSLAAVTAISGGAITSVTALATGVQHVTPGANSMAALAGAQATLATAGFFVPMVNISAGPGPNIGFHVAVQVRAT